MVSNLCTSTFWVLVDCCVLVLGLTEKYACLPWWLGGSSKKGRLDGSCYLFLLQIEYGQTLLVDCWSVTPCWRRCHIRQARSDKQVVWWRIHCCIRGFIGAGWQRSVCGAFDRFLAIGSSRSTEDINRGYPAAYQPKGWCHRAGRSLPTSGEHLTSPCQSDDDPWHLQQ